VDLSTLNALQFLEPILLSPVGASGRHDQGGKPVTYARALEYIESGTIAVAPLITHRYASLDEVPSAFATDYASEGYVKGVVLQ
jgi:L-iditol 2-dehydrogenase